MDFKLKIVIPEQEAWDAINERFIDVKKTTLILEHSLISLHRWEAIYERPLLDEKRPMTFAETVDYVKCMTIAPNNVDEFVYELLTPDDIERVNAYIKKPMTATTITERGDKPKRKTIPTAEVLYGMMIALNIPVEFEKWHLNQLITLIRVCQIQQDPNPKKMPRKDVAAMYRARNTARRKANHTKG